MSVPKEELYSLLVSAQSKVCMSVLDLEKQELLILFRMGTVKMT